MHEHLVAPPAQLVDEHRRHPVGRVGRHRNPHVPILGTLGGSWRFGRSAAAPDFHAGLAAEPDSMDRYGALTERFPGRRSIAHRGALAQNQFSRGLLSFACEVR
ncbi:hypothetical protein Athai_12380 [Actinocatenispora thailandica]|uniref:Uncharacterized protein n=1 Tax=Actinocatenispora thailandica TaxID=227318 RepID=A0A7R7DL77_9ACTN|nr:hypothetical protein Athai_12380 [Actinocatenispora thailandica]